MCSNASFSEIRKWSLFRNVAKRRVSALLSVLWILDIKVLVTREEVH